MSTEKKDNISIIEINEGNKDAFKKAYMEYYDMLLGLSIQYLKNKESAEEIVQDAFLKLWQNRESLSPSSNIKNYLYTIVKNSCISALRKKLTRSKYISESQFLEFQTNFNAMNQLNSSSLEYDDLQKKISEIITSLPPAVKTVFEMSRNEELTYSEIAEELSISVKTVEARISKALSFFRKELKDYIASTFIILPCVL